MALLAGGIALPLAAAPVDASSWTSPAPDATELALRWVEPAPTESSTATLLRPLPALPGPTIVPLATAPRTTVLATDGGVPDPSAYALMGLALVGAGLAVQRWRRGASGRGQRGASKKT